MSFRTFYLMRHGETDYNARSLIQGRSNDIELNENGRQQATRASEIFSQIPLDLVASSPLKRAAATADIVRNNNIACMENKLEIHRSVDLEEMSFGTLEGKYYPPSTEQESCHDELTTIAEHWTEGREYVSFPQGENPLQVRERAFRCLHKLADNYQFKNALIVTHGRFLKVLLNHLLKVPYSQVRPLSNCNFCILRFNEQTREFFVSPKEACLSELPEREE